jgi:DNA-binding PadR family transcriptional regulator
MACKARHALGLTPHKWVAFNYTRSQYIHYAYNWVVPRPPQPDPESLLPLPFATFHILMALAAGDRHGYAIIQEVAQRTNNCLRLGAGTLYRSLQRMLEQGLIIETASRLGPENDDERRRYYRITSYGESVARAEARRLTELVRLARASGFAGGKA